MLGEAPGPELMAKPECSSSTGLGCVLGRSLDRPRTALAFFLGTGSLLFALLSQLLVEGLAEGWIELDEPDGLPDP